MPEPKATATAEPEKEKAKPVVSNNGPAQKTFAELMGGIMAAVMADHRLMPQAKSDLEMWYNAQDLDNRKEIARKVKAEFEYSKGILESAYHHFMNIAFQDMQ